MHLAITLLVVMVIVAVGKLLGWDKVILVRSETLQSRPLKIIGWSIFALLMLVFAATVTWAVIETL